MEFQSVSPFCWSQLKRTPVDSHPSKSRTSIQPQQYQKRNQIASQAQLHTPPPGVLRAFVLLHI